MRDTGKVLSALLAGVAAGTVLGVLFAPDKGSETRDRLNESLTDLGEAIKERAEEQFGQLNDLKDKLIATFYSKASEVEDAIDEEIEEHA